jgi:LysM repeat protein
MSMPHIVAANRLVAMCAVAGVATLLAACGSDPSTSGTLPPIATTTTTTTTMVTTTTKPEYYRVQSGDTLSKIAKHFGVDPQDLMAANGITNPDHIEAGQKLKIPAAKVVASTLPSAPTSAATTSTGP